MHALLFTGHAHALAGRPAQALAAFARYTAEVERRQVPRFAGRAVNFAGWVLRNLGARQEGLDHHLRALQEARDEGTSEVTIAALEDLAEQCLDDGDADGAESRLAQALALLEGDLVFGWRLRLKHGLLTGRLALLSGRPERALAEASELEAAASALGVPRYTSVARLLGYRASRALGRPVDYGAVEDDLDLLDGCVAIEAWRWTCDLAADFASPAWLDRASDRAARLAMNAGRHADGLRREAGRRLAAVGTA
jgi:tetratricopeptide (TPR) repeat protein